ncbi:MAG TPA: hypothetical protein VHQ90_10155 [Thermoanaerobaculia bacterium]|nr:hypothetical protein [Thermoanaerobaculia bacterium]
MMPSMAHFALRFRCLTLLRASLVAGALYDAAFAVLMVAAPRVPARTLALPLPPLPAGTFYLWILAILLLMLALLYGLAARDTRRYSGIVAVAIGGRIAGGVALLLAVRLAPGLAGLYPLAAVDLGLGLVHAALWWPARA